MDVKREWVPPRWGPIADPAPWGRWSGWPTIRWPDIWGPVDPAPLREKLLERITVEDLVALRYAELDAARTQLQAQAKLIGKQMEILAKYGQVK